MRRGGAALAHGHDIWAVLEGLVKVADAAGDVLVALEGEGDNGDETKGEPRVALDDMASHVTAVVALAYHALVAGHLLAEGMFAAGEEKEHDGRRQ